MTPKKLKDMPFKSPLFVLIPLDDMRALRAKAREMGISMSELARRAIKAEIEK